MKELINLRKEREKHYLNEDGTITAYMYDEDIHYLDNGEYKEIDNSLIEESEYITNKNNNFKIKLYKTKYLVNIDLDNNNYLNISLKNSFGVFPKIENNEVIYQDVLPNVDFHYLVHGKSLKENIYLKDKINTNITFKVETNLELVVDNNTIKAKNNNEVIYTFSPLFMVNSNNSVNNNCNYVLTKDNGVYEIELKLDQEYLDNASYPVIVDPTISTKKLGIYDNYISSKYPDKCMNNLEFLSVGAESDDITRILLKFDLPTIPVGSHIVKSSLFTQTYKNNYHYFNRDERAINVHKITSSWDEKNVTWNNFDNKYDSLIETYSYPIKRALDDLNKEDFQTEFDITNLVKKWNSGEDNFGLILKWGDETYSSNSLPYLIYSKTHDLLHDDGRRPYIMINYRYQKGILEYMDYSTVYYTYGKSLINNCNGNICNIFNVGETNSKTLPVSLSIIYNSDDANYSALNSVKGWKFNYNESIENVIIDSINTLKYEDNAGSVIYFYQNEDGVYEDENGIGYTIVQENSNYVLIDKNNTKKNFELMLNKYLLTSVTDTSNNKIVITYENNRITKITDDKNNSIDIIYNNDSIQITSTNLNCNLKINNERITNILVNNNSTEFGYTETGLIDKIKDCSGLYALYEYYSSNKVKKISQCGKNNTIGNVLFFEYSNNSTSITLDDVTKNILSFDNYGHTLSVITQNTNEQILKKSYGYNEEYKGTEMGIKNLDKTTSSSHRIKFIDNLLCNSSFEDDISHCNFEIINSYVVSTESSLGTKSLMLDPGSSIKYNIKESGNYTISFDLKTDSYLLEILLYEENNGVKKLVDSYETEALDSYDFCRYDVSGYFERDTKLSLEINKRKYSFTYLDNIQLEKGLVANPYNLISNPSFINNYNSWNITSHNNQSEEINNYTLSGLNDKEKKLTIHSRIDSSTTLSQYLKYPGVSGDVYTLSFWYKNSGVIDEEFSDVGLPGNKATLVFYPYDEFSEEVGMSPEIYPLRAHSSNWQFFCKSFVVPYDYEDFMFNVISEGDVNSLELTDFMLVKNYGKYEYEYDEKGNLVGFSDFQNSKTNLNYDENKNLIHSNDSQNKSTSFEYDNTPSSNLIESITNEGLCTKTIYDESNLPIKNIIKNVGKLGCINNGDYKIRCKGTNKYLLYNLAQRKINISEEVCNNNIFEFEQGDNLWIIKPTTFNRYSLTTNDNLPLLSQENNFKVKMENLYGNAYLIKNPLNNYCLKVENNSLIFAPYEENNQNFIFVLESNNYTEYIEEKNIYNSNNLIEKSIDSLGKETIFDYDETGKLESLTEANGVKIEYMYDSKGNRKEVKNPINTAEYKYSNENLSEIIFNDKKIKLGYDECCNNTTIDINNNRLLTNEYNTKNKLVKKTYGNGGFETYKYDSNGNITEKNFNDNTSNKYYYNNFDNLSKIISNDETYKYYYDFANRLKEKIVQDFSISFDYNSTGDIINKKYSLFTNYRTSKKDFNVNYTYDGNGNIIEVCANEINLSDYFDELGRKKSRVINSALNVEYTYKSNGKKTSLIIDTIKIGGELYKYYYDDVYNVIQINKNNNIFKAFKYDSINELILEDNYELSKRIEYTYNSSGNLTSKKEYSLINNELLNEDVFAYENTDWTDQLTRYNNTAINYDSNGNITKIGDQQFTWQKGNQLSTYKTNDKLVEYKYDVDGIRSEKIFGNKTVKYYTEMSKIILEKRDNNLIYYYRDSDGNLLGFKYNNDVYYYKLNFENDIIGIYDATYNQIVRYTYDSWGNIISITDNDGNKITDNNNIALINPFRWKSYYYDEESNLYYLNSRYYSPILKRFISIDPLIVNEDTNLSYNLYLYTCNNPIEQTDNNGNFSFWDALDVVSFCDSAYQMIKKPSIKNGISLALDTISLLPILPSVGVVSKGSKALSKTTKTSKVVDKSSDTLTASDRALDSIRKGQTAEAAVSKKTKIPKNTKTIYEPYMAKKRIPDFINTEVLLEVKNVKYQSYTRQLRDYKQYADQKGLKMTLYVRDPEKVSKKIYEAGIQICPIPFE